MNKKKLFRSIRIIYLIAIVASTLTLLATLAYPFEIKMDNNTDHKMVYDLIWLDCDWSGTVQPQSMAVGEIGPNDTRNMGIDYKVGNYKITWDRPDIKKRISHFKIHVSSPEGILTSKPTSLIFVKGTFDRYSIEIQAK